MGRFLFFIPITIVRFSLFSKINYSIMGLDPLSIHFIGCHKQHTKIVCRMKKAEGEIGLKKDSERQQFEKAFQDRIGRSPAEFIQQKLANGTEPKTIQYQYEMMAAEIARQNSFATPPFSLYASLKKKAYHKLVRDRIPEIIEASGKTCTWETLSDEAYLQLLDEKLNEELAEYLGAYPEQSTYSSADFLEKMVAWFKRRGVRVECVQTDNGIEFTNRFSTNKKDRLTRFELTAARLGIRHKLIRPYTPRHNGKVERSHREDQKRFYDTHRFFSLADFGVQLAAHQNRSNDLPMRPLAWLSPKEKLAAFFESLAVQDV